MSQELKITVVVENTAQGIATLGEHGLSYWLEWAGRTILFDAGQGGALSDNLQQMQLPLESC